MRSLNNWYFKIYFFLSLFVSFITSQQSCQTPDRPANGDYFPKEKKFRPGDKINYNCTDGLTLMGKETSKCKSNGDWSNPTPFCELKAKLKNPYTRDRKGKSNLNLKIIDGNSSTCCPLRDGEFIGMTLVKPGSVYALRIFMETGTTKIEIRTGEVVCDSFNKFIETSQWVLIQCNKNNNVISDLVKIQDKSDRGHNNTLCEIEVYVREEDGCEFPPKTRISNGYFEVTRTTAKLVCEEGYKSENPRLVCESNDWVPNGLQCNEILCDPLLNMTRTPGSEWIFLDAVRKISAGTRRQLKCDSGYKKVGSPEIITCQKNGFWTKSNATCVEEQKTKVTKTIIFGSVGAVVVLIILALLGTTIYFVRKQRSREVVVVYKQATEGSMVSGSEGDYASAYYESIQSTVPLPPTSTRPTAQMLSEGYFAPLDSKETLKKQPMPADIAFGTLKQSTLYSC